MPTLDPMLHEVIRTNLLCIVACWDHYACIGHLEFKIYNLETTTRVLSTNSHPIRRGEDRRLVHDGKDGAGADTIVGGDHYYKKNFSEVGLLDFRRWATQPPRSKGHG
jgi:hypothetical protein